MDPLAYDGSKTKFEEKEWNDIVDKSDYSNFIKTHASKNLKTKVVGNFIEKVGDRRRQLQ